MPVPFKPLELDELLDDDDELLLELDDDELCPELPEPPPSPEARTILTLKYPAYPGSISRGAGYTACRRSLVSACRFRSVTPMPLTRFFSTLSSLGEYAMSCTLRSAMIYHLIPFFGRFILLHESAGYSRNTRAL